MPTEPAIKRTIAFFDGQNLFHAVKVAFGYTYPNFDALKLPQTICQQQGWNLIKVCFYTGVPDLQDNPKGHYFWRNKLAAMGRQGIKVYSRSLVYRNQTIKLPDDTEHTFLVASEKGIDIRLALDIIRMGLDGEYDVALVFSQDQDLSEVADEIRDITKVQGRWIKIASSFPISPTYRNRRGIDKTDWIPIDRPTYDACTDPRDYRPKRKT
ncbi:MAG: NYN domain-containing protein [Anaerolineales bacterium]